MHGNADLKRALEEYVELKNKYNNNQLVDKIANDAWTAFQKREVYFYRQVGSYPEEKESNNPLLEYKEQLALSYQEHHKRRLPRMKLLAKKECLAEGIKSLKAAEEKLKEMSNTDVRSVWDLKKQEYRHQRRINVSDRQLSVLNQAARSHSRNKSMSDFRKSMDMSESEINEIKKKMQESYEYNAEDEGIWLEANAIWEGIIINEEMQQAAIVELAQLEKFTPINEAYQSAIEEIKTKFRSKIHDQLRSQFVLAYNSLVRRICDWVASTHDSGINGSNYFTEDQLTIIRNLPLLEVTTIDDYEKMMKEIDRQFSETDDEIVLALAESADDGNVSVSSTGKSSLSRSN